MLPGNEPAPDFSDPLGLLKACHQRILGFCDLLEKLDPYLKKNGLDDDALQAIRKVYHYFTTAGKLHHLDEEQDLFPLLIEQSTELADIIQTLQQDHIRLDSTWAQLEHLLSEPAIIKDDPDFCCKVTALCNEYRKHIKKEEEGILDKALQVLDKKQLTLMGQNMKNRRHITSNRQA